MVLQTIATGIRGGVDLPSDVNDAATQTRKIYSKFMLAVHI
jgi:hypothetical protein